MIAATYSIVVSCRANCLQHNDPDWYPEGEQFEIGADNYNPERISRISQSLPVPVVMPQIRLRTPPSAAFPIHYPLCTLQIVRMESELETAS
jgi:hypothetical protein